MSSGAPSLGLCEDDETKEISTLMGEDLHGGSRILIDARDLAQKRFDTIGGWLRSTGTWWKPLQEQFLVTPRQIPRRIISLFGIAILTLLSLLYMFSQSSSSLIHTKTVLSDGTTFRKPQDLKIIGIVFYGRRATVEILDCYLRKNLASHGGMLDAVHFIVNTDVKEDMTWIDELVASVSDYAKVEMREGTNFRDYEQVWRQAVQADHMYVKFDDDLVYMSDNAVAETVFTLINHPEAFLVLGNLINSASLGWVHHRQSAIYSYLPELNPPPPSDPKSPSYGPRAWRASALPTLPHPWDAFPDTQKSWDGGLAPIGTTGAPPYPAHRWLPLRDNGVNISITPIWASEYQPNGPNWRRWALGAQQHYSLLENIERGTLFKYHTGGENGIWNYRFDHANINFMAVWANDILDHLPFSVDEDDEAHFSMTLPRETGRECLVQSRAITSHFSFGVQGEMYDTDLLSRYRALANEKVCGKRNQIPDRPMGRWWERNEVVEAGGEEAVPANVSTPS